MDTVFRDQYGKPIYVLGLQAHNSSCGCPEMLDTAIEAVKLYHGNTIEVPVYWYQLEPQEGVYDTSDLEDLILRVRAAGLRLVILWFGSSKNSDMTYVPEWVKADPDRFWMAVGPDGQVTPQISPFCRECYDADRKAFTVMMKTVRALDEQERTVIAVQVENEIGLYPLDRCYSKAAQAEFEKGVPDELMDLVIPDSGAKDTGRDWYEHFGRHAHETFTCWEFAKRIEEIASAGKAVYDLPMYINAVVGELRQELAGQSYSSGSPVGRMIDVYKIGAPSIAICAPDIYLPNKEQYLRVCASHTRENNPLFIPETGTSGDGFAVNIIHAAGDYGAIGICGFGAEHTIKTNGELTDTSKPVAASMQILSLMAPALLRYGHTDRIFAVSQGEYQDLLHVLRKNWHITFHFTSRGKKGSELGRNMRVCRLIADDPEVFNQRGRAIVYEAGDDEFYIAGVGFTARFLRRADPYDTRPYTNYVSRASTELAALTIEEGHFDEDLNWVCEFRRRGDEVDCGAFVYPGIILRVKLNPRPLKGYSH